MTNYRLLKALAATILGNGLLLLSILADPISDAFASEKAEEAKRFTEMLSKAKDTKTKIFALEELGKLAQIKKSFINDALPDIYKLTEDPDPGVRAAAAEALGKAAEPYEKAGKILLKMVKTDKDDQAKIGAINGLAVMGPEAKDALPDLRAIVKENAGNKKSKLLKAAQNAVLAIGGKKK